MVRALAIGLALLGGSLAFEAAKALPKIQHWETDTGMRVYFVEAPELPMIDVKIAFDAGSARDGDQHGIARMTTSLLDEGAGKWDAGTIAERFEDVGARYSAGVDKDMATLSLRSLTQPSYLEKALETFITVASAPRFEQRDFERIKNLTLVAIQSQEQEPGDIGQKAFYRALYGDHPYAHPTIGTTESVQELSPTGVRRFYERYFVARNGVLAIVGAISRTEAETIAERISAALPQGAPAPALPPVPPLEEAKTIRVAFPSEQAHVYMGQPGMRRGDADYFRLYVGNHILGGNGFNSRLVKQVRVKRGLSYSVYSYFFPEAVEGPFQVNLQTRIAKTDQAVQVARSTVEDFIRKGPTAQELETATKNLTGGFPLRIDSNADIVGYLVVIGFYQLPLDYLETFNAKVSAVTSQDITKAFGERLDVQRMVTVIVGGA